MNSQPLDNGFIQYLSRESRAGKVRIPSLTTISRIIGVSVSILREQLAVARAIGLVDVKPRTGIRLIPYSFRPTVENSVFYAINLDDKYFQQFSDFRSHVEASYWYQAVSLLKSEDKEQLGLLVEEACVKLDSSPVQIPHQEHKSLHLLIYSRLENTFVKGILEAYWNLYEAAGLNIYNDIEYLRQVWKYHQKIVESIQSGNYSSGHQYLLEHMDLILKRPKPTQIQKFE